MKLYAIGFKEHVELRTAKNPPRAVISKLSRSVTVKVPLSYYDPGFRYPEPGQPPLTRAVKKKVNFTVVYHIGGKVITSMKTSKFQYMTKIGVGNGVMVEVPAELCAQFLTGEDKNV